MRTEIVPATLPMLTAFYGHAPQRSMFAFAGLADGQPLAIFGLYYDDARLVLFSDIRPEARRFKKRLVQGAFRVMALAREKAVPVYAVADCVEGSVRLLERLGFKPQPGGRVWQA